LRLRVSDIERLAQQIANALSRQTTRTGASLELTTLRDASIIADKGPYRVEQTLRQQQQNSDYCRAVFSFCEQLLDSLFQILCS
jgi:hypothetical protein